MIDLRIKGQVSVEYLIIIAISFAILIPGGYFFYNYTRTSSDSNVRSQISQLGNAMITSSESIYGLSDGSLTTLDLTYPRNIRDIYLLDDKELIIRYELASGMTESVFFSKISLSGMYNYTNYNSTGHVLCASLPCGNSSLIHNNVTHPGKHQLQFRSSTNYVTIVQSK